ncbi:MAG: hypothetical protein ACLFWD_01150 [Anaerolineales bacterium]
MFGRVDRYPVEQQVHVCFDPDQPERAALELGSNRGSNRGKMLIVLGLIMSMAASAAINVRWVSG